MPKFNVTVTINKPVDTVYQAFIDSDNMIKWTKDLEKVEIVKGRFGEIGATMHLHYNQRGRRSMLEDTLKYLEPGRKIKSVVTGGGLCANVETEFTPVNDNTALTMLWNGKGNNVFVTFILTLLKKGIKKSAQAELDKFKELIENKGVRFI